MVAAGSVLVAMDPGEMGGQMRDWGRRLLRGGWDALGQRKKEKDPSLPADQISFCLCSRSNTIQLTRMDYAMKSLSLLYPRSRSRHVAVSTAVVTQQLVSKPSRETPRARPCRVSTADRKVRKGVMAHSLEDLLVKVRGLPVVCLGSLQALAES